eukprot:11138115-Heterocapsa_arctica.AAC.1
MLTSSPASAATAMYLSNHNGQAAVATSAASFAVSAGGSEEVSTFNVDVLACKRCHRDVRHEQDPALGEAHAQQSLHT